VAGARIVQAPIRGRGPTPEPDCPHAAIRIAPAPTCWRPSCPRLQDGSQQSPSSVLFSRRLLSNYCIARHRSLNQEDAALLCPPGMQAPFTA
jgi:hypothetical protein